MTMTLYTKQKSHSESTMISVGSRVQRRMGDWHPNKHMFGNEKTLHGTVMTAQGKGVWDILWDDGLHDPNVLHRSTDLTLSFVTTPCYSFKKRQQMVLQTLPIPNQYERFKTTPKNSGKNTLPSTPISLDISSSQKKTTIFQPVFDSDPSQPELPSNLLTLANVAELKESNFKPSGEDPNYTEFLSEDDDYVGTLSENEEVVNPVSTDNDNFVEDQEHEDNSIAANRYLESLVGKVFLVNSETKNEFIRWEVIRECDDDFFGNGLTHLKDTKLTTPGQFFWDLFPCNFTKDLARLNLVAEMQINRNNCRLARQKKKLRKWTPVTENEFKTFLSLMVASANQARTGRSLWMDSSKLPKANRLFQSVPDLGRFMPRYRFDEIRTYAPYIFCDLNAQGNQNPWWPIAKLEKKFNENRNKFFGSQSTEYCIDESMSAYRPKTTKHGNLPHLTYCRRKPEDLGTKIKLINDCYSGSVLSLEIMLGKDTMQKKICTGIWFQCGNLS